MVKTLFEESFVICYLDDGIPVLSHRWKTPTNAENFRHALMRMIGLFKALKKEYPNLTWLGDTNHLGVLSMETQTWLKESWTAHLLDGGVHYHALVVPKDVFAKFAMKKFKDNLTSHHPGEIVIEHFADEPTANHWLRQCVALPEEQTK
ncbi:MAG: hypothetical protein H7Z75_18850 [Ferruginibacter sp.]|nr:hypothetical protein [Cytophagales bacterium]